MPTATGGPRGKRGAAAGANTSSPGHNKRLKTEVEAGRPQEQVHLHASQHPGHPSAQNQQMSHLHSHPQAYNPNQHAGPGGMYADHTHPGSGIPPMEPPLPYTPGQHYPQATVRSYPSYNTAPVAPSNMTNGSINSPYPPQTPTPAPAANAQNNQTSGPASSEAESDLPPNPRIRTDGKGRDPYNIETICKTLGISSQVWDQKLRTELTKVIDRHGLAGQKVIPTNLAARESAVEDWIRNCPEWLNEPNDKYRKVYAMDRLKCGMADIRRTQNQRKKKGEKGAEVTNGVAHDAHAKADEASTTSPEHIPNPTPTPRSQKAALTSAPPPNAATIPIFSDSRQSIGGTPAAQFPQFGNASPTNQPMSAPPPPGPGSVPPAPYNAMYLAPDMIMLTVVESFSDRRSTLSSQDFLPNGEYSWANVMQALREDLNFNPAMHRIYYEGPYGRVYVNSDRTLRNAISFEATRNNRYPKWEIEQH